MSQTITLNGWDYPIRFEESHYSGTVAVIGNDPVTRRFIRSYHGGEWNAEGSMTLLSKEESAAIDKLYEERPKPTLEERVERLERRSGAGWLTYPSLTSYPKWRH